jgi:hypothetical protein
MPWTITVLPANPPSVKGSPLRTSVRDLPRNGALVAGELAALGVADVAANAVGDAVALAAGGVEEPPQATTNTSASLRGVANAAIPMRVRSGCLHGSRAAED